MLAAFAFFFGLIVGSFLNVLVLRRNIRSIQGRSGCLSCEAQLAWYDLIPILSWVALRGRCRACGSALSIQYPLVELSTGLSFAALAAVPHMTIVYLLIAFTIAAILVAIAAYDIRHTIIPDLWVYTFSLLALSAMFIRMSPDADLLLQILSGPIAALPIFSLWFVSGGTWMGLGDAKLSLGIGWLLGPLWGTVAIFSAFIIGALISVGILLPLPYVVRALRKRGIARLRGTVQTLTMKSEVPFGPFLVFACFMFWFAELFNVPLPILWF